ncbi:MAG TPA: FAD-dependent oxidoreductase [Nevskiaceae bacterium]|nr:FAD-dependent oxidoreductase [Nevskiaceae bacterium]
MKSGTGQGRARGRVVVVGGGVIGLYSAWRLVEAGWSVTLIDAAAPDSREPASWAAGGILSDLPPGSAGPPIREWLDQSRERYPADCERLQALSGIDPEFWRCGMRVFDADRSEWHPQVAQVRSPRLLQALAAALDRLGVDRRHGTVLGLWRRPDRVCGVHTADGPIEADAVVVCAGIGSTQLTPAVAIEPVRGQMLLFAAPREPLTEIWYRDDFYLIPRRDGQVVAGSTLEWVGTDRHTTAEARAGLQARAVGLYPALAGVAVLDHWAGLRPRRPDAPPLIAEIEPGLYASSGHYRLGVSLAPASADILRALIEATLA